MNISAQGYEAFVYLEHRLIPVSTVSVTQAVNQPPSASFIIPPSQWGTYIFPGSRVLIFLKKLTEDKMFLWFSGEVANKPDLGVGFGNKNITLQCLSDFAALSGIPIVSSNITSLVAGATSGKSKLVTGSGSIIVPSVHDSIGAVQMWGPLINSKDKGTIIPGKTDLTDTDQCDDVASAKGKIFALLETLLLSHTISQDKLRRTRFLDRLAMYIDENAVQLIQNQGLAAVQFSQNALYQLFQGEKFGWQVLVQYLGIFLHEIVPTLPMMNNKFDIPARGEMYLPIGVGQKLAEGTLINNGTAEIKMTDYMSVERNRDSIMEMFIKPNMVGTFPPSCNVITPDKYNYFNLTQNLNITRMAIQLPILPNLGSTILEPRGLEEATATALKYTSNAGGSVSDTNMTKFSEVYIHRGNSWVSNEERLFNKVAFQSTQMNPMVQNTLISNIQTEDNKKKEDDADRLRYPILMAAEALNQVLFSSTQVTEPQMEIIQNTLVNQLFEAGVSKQDAVAIAKETVSQSKAAIDSAFKDYEKAVAAAEKKKESFVGTVDYIKDIYNSKLYGSDITSTTSIVGMALASAKTSVASQQLAAASCSTDDIFKAWKQHADRMFMDSRQGQMQIQGAFNLDAMVGFSIMFLDNETGRDVMGYLVQKTDILDFSTGSASTQYVVTNAELVEAYDFNSQYKGSFQLKKLGIERFAWGKIFDYSKMIYGRYLNDVAYVPLNHELFISSANTKVLSKRFSGTPDDIAALKLDKKRVSKDDICAHLGLSYYENNPDMLRADIRDFTSSDLGSVRNKEQEAGLLPDKTNVLKHNPDLKERFYLFGDSLSNFFESEFSGVQLLKLLDSRQGSAAYIFDAMDSTKGTSCNAWADMPYLPGDTKSVLKDYMLKPLTPKFVEANQTYTMPISPRWSGNPGVLLSDLFLSYISITDPVVTYRQIWADGKFPTSDMKESVARTKKELQASFERIYGTVATDDHWKPGGTDADVLKRRDIKEAIDALIEKTTKQFTTIESGSMAYYTALALNGTFDEATLKQKIIQNIDATKASSSMTLPPTVTVQMADVVIANINAARKNIGAALEKWFAGATEDYIKKQLEGKELPCAPVPRPMSEQEVIAFRQRIVDNVAEELSYYARTPGTTSL